MRAREFTINVPITIKINGDGDPELEMDQITPDEDELHNNPIMVAPLQQGLELAKATLGKESPVISKLTKSEPTHGAEQTPDIELERIRQLISPSP